MKKVLGFFMAVMLLICSVCGASAEYLTLGDTFVPDDNGIYKDLGNYLIELNYTEADFDAARTYLDNKLRLGDANSADMPATKIDMGLVNDAGACTACAKLNENGEVIIGRNLDNEVSVCPAFIIHTSFGKYPTLSVRFNNYDTYTYEEFKQSGYLDEGYMNYMPFCVTDAMNSEGLFVEANVREPSLYLMNTGTNPGKERVLVNMLVQMIAMNCATVEDAVNYLKNEINIVSTPYVNMQQPTQYAYYVGDATGCFGVIEIARNEVHFIPYQPAQANYYLDPDWNATETGGAGYGRMSRVLNGLEKVKTLEDMMEHMKQPMWYQEIMNLEYTYKDENGVVRFVDKNGNPSIDWRSDFANMLPVNAEGHIDLESGDPSLTENSDVRWMMNDNHFEELMPVMQAFLDSLGWKEKLIEYYNGNELPLREAQTIFTTGVSYAVNCAQKTMLIKFWEKEDLTYKVTVGD